jgi:hypothetical protein
MEPVEEEVNEENAKKARRNIKKFKSVNKP